MLTIKSTISSLKIAEFASYWVDVMESLNFCHLLAMLPVTKPCFQKRR